MKASQVLFSVIKTFTGKKGDPHISFSDLIGYLSKCVDNDRKGTFDSFTTNAEDIAIASLMELEKDGRVSLEYTGDRIDSLFFPGYYAGIIEQSYKKNEENPTNPFPEEQDLDLVLSNDQVRPVDVKTGFMELLNTDGRNGIVRITFPGNIRSVIVTEEIVRKKLLHISLQKLRVYLNTGGNANFVYNKLRPVCGKNEQTLKEMIKKLQTNLDVALSTIKNPTTFSFSFWAHFSNLILREFKDKDNKLSNEHDYCRAAYFLGYYNQFYQQASQKEKDRVKGLKKVEELITKPPFVFSISDIYDFRDEKGKLLDSRYSRENLHNFLADKLKIKDESELLPEIVRLRTQNNREYYIHRETIVPLTLKKIEDASFFYRKKILDAWIEALRNLEKVKECDDDAAFEKYLSEAVSEEDPLLRTLLSYELLLLATRGTQRGKARQNEMSAVFNKDMKDILPLSYILGLHRNELLRDAKRTLPLWQTNAFFRGLVLFFRRLTGSGRSRERVSAESGRKRKNPMTTDKIIVEKESARLESTNDDGARDGKAQGQKQQVAFRKAIYNLKEKYSTEYGSIEKGMTELINEWNKLLDPKAKKDLVEDVNSLTRDYLRSIKRSLAASPPDKKRIMVLTDTLIENKALSGIKKKEPLKRYLELYMVKYLSEKNIF